MTNSYPKAPVGTTRLRFQFVQKNFKPVGCIAYRTKILGWNPDGSYRAEISVGTSTRNPADSWVRREARDLAQGRMEETVFQEDIYNTHQLKEIILESVFRNPKTTNRLRRQIAQNFPILVKTFV